MNQPLGFGLLGIGGILLVKSITGSSFSQVVQGHPASVSQTGQNIAGAGVAGVGQSIAGGSSSGAVSTSTSGRGVAAQLMNYFQAHGLSKAGAAAIVGNWQQESGLNPAEQGGYLAQWLGDRLTNLENFAANLHQPVTSVGVQAAFALHELQTSYPGLLSELQTTNDPAQAAADVSNLYERPAAWAANVPGRQANAVAAYNGTL